MMSSSTTRIWILAAVTLLWTGAALAESWEKQLPKKLEGSFVTEHLGDHVDLDVRFVDHHGKSVKLSDYFADGKPVLLTMNYYECKMLCSLQLTGLLEGLRGLDWTAGDEFRIVTVGIDPREDWELARDKRESYLDELGRGDVDWTFLTGEFDAIISVAEDVGFGYQYDMAQDQFAHTAVLMFVSPDGKISRYLYGIEYRPFDLKAALSEAAEGEVGTTIERIILSCFHYDETEGRYGPWAFGIMRLGGAVVVVVVGFFLAIMWWREASRRRLQDVG